VLARYPLPAPLEETLEFHLPGHNFTGPGTHVIERVEQSVQPVNRTDAIALTHDINYILAGNNPKLADFADEIAMSKTDYFNFRDGYLDVGAMLMDAGLTSRSKLGLHTYETNIPVYMAEKLRDKVLHSVDYQFVRDKYGIDSSWFIT